jgi:anion-transporting  ArsA/GET3 family ATPase
MQTLIFTGPSGANALAAAATAAAAAADGARVLLASTGPAHPVAALAGTVAVNEPLALSPNLDLWCLDPLADLATVWGTVRTTHAPPIDGDELPLIPGTDLALAALRLRTLGARYDLVCVDVGPPEPLIRALSAPDTFRWILRIFLGLDRGPGRSSASVARAILPVALLPIISDWSTRIQDARVHLERLRDEMTRPEAVQVRYIFSPDRGGFDAARIAVPALQLCGLAVECLVAGPTLPTSLRGTAVDALLAEQQQIITAAGEIFHGRAIYALEALPTPSGAAALAAIGTRLYGEDSPLPGPPLATPVILSGSPDPSVALNLPGLPRELLGLTLSGDELIVRVGPYRRHLLLPDGLRGTTAIKASRQDETLIIRPRA